MTFQKAYVAKRRAEAAWEGEEKTFGGSAIFGATPEKSKEKLQRQEHQRTAGPAPLTNQMMDSLEGYLDNIAAAATQTAEMEGRSRSYLLVWIFQLILSPDIIKKSSGCLNR